MNRVRLYREQKGMTQEQLAKESEVSRPFLSQIENEARQPSIKALKRIAKALQVPVIQLIEEAE